MAFTRHRLDRPINGHSIPIGSRLVLAATAALALHTRSPRPDATSNHQLPDAHDPAHSTPTQEAA
jgi:hypothetical protein